MTKKALPTVSIKGTPYIPVKERVLYLANEVKDYSIHTNYWYYPERKLWVVKAELTLYKDKQNLYYSGLAQEIESDNYRDVNATSALENCETSAVGRACAMAGIGVLESGFGLASADEVQKAISRTPKEPCPLCNQPASFRSGVKNGREWKAVICPCNGSKFQFLDDKPKIDMESPTPPLDSLPY